MLMLLLMLMLMLLLVLLILLLLMVMLILMITIIHDGMDLQCIAPEWNGVGGSGMGWDGIKRDKTGWKGIGPRPVESPSKGASDATRHEIIFTLPSFILFRCFSFFFILVLILTLSGLCVCMGTIYTLHTLPWR